MWTSKKVKNIAQPNQLNPKIPRVGVGTGGTYGGAFITGGASTDSATIKVEIGTPGTDYDYGTIYICTSSGSVFVSVPADDFLEITVS